MTPETYSEAAGATPVSRPGLLARRISPEAGWLTGICLLDLLTTLWWISQGQAHEGNPFLAHYLSYGHVPFIAAKLFTFVPAVVIAEWYRPRNPALIHRVLRWTIILYLAIYVAGVFGHYRNAAGFYRAVFG
ncbi:MAG TPA: DUF5658 family protein [Armatimonadota bacterium]|nr:DUF5658 family protein [Armatimonadota bacterium]